MYTIQFLFTVHSFDFMHNRTLNLANLGSDRKLLKKIRITRTRQKPIKTNSQVMINIEFLRTDGILNLYSRTLSLRKNTIGTNNTIDEA